MRILACFALVFSTTAFSGEAWRFLAVIKKDESGFLKSPLCERIESDSIEAAALETIQGVIKVRCDLKNISRERRDDKSPYYKVNVYYECHDAFVSFQHFTDKKSCDTDSLVLIKLTEMQAEMNLKKP